jgi:hypothetical protein
MVVATGHFIGEGSDCPALDSLRGRDAIEPLLSELADDPARLAGVEVLGVDGHVWHHSPTSGEGP